MSHTDRTQWRHALLTLVAPVLLLAGCASAPPIRPNSLAEAEQAIVAAEKRDASRYAAAELDEARQKLASAERAVAASDLIIAERLGHEAEATAELAAARTEAAKATAINTEMTRSTKALTEEMQRAGDKR
jgi:putative cell wall-binding protein